MLEGATAIVVLNDIYHVVNSDGDVLAEGSTLLWDGNHISMHSGYVSFDESYTARIDDKGVVHIE